MVEDESDVFEITDFTTASDWERFIARLEEQIHEWKLNTVTANPPLTKGELTFGTWEEKSVTVQYVDYSFVLTRYQLRQESDLTRDESSFGDVAQIANMQLSTSTSPFVSQNDETASVPLIWQDMMSSENAFPSRAHCLCRWYGLRDFVVITTALHMEDIVSESRISILLSAMSIAAVNTSCQVPMFLQTHARGRRLYSGVCESPGFRTTFEMVELKSAPHHYMHLAGLLDVFKAKVAAPVCPLPPVSVAVRLTYTIHDWTAYSWPQLPPDVDNFSGEVGVTRLDELPFGAYDDPIVELSLSATWPTLSEDMIVDSDVYSDLDPLQAPHWSVRTRFTEKPRCLLGDYLNEFVRLCFRKDSVRQLLGKAAIDDSSEVDVSKAFNILTEHNLPVPSLEHAVSRATAKLVAVHEEAPINAERLRSILHFLFPDVSSSASDSNQYSGGKGTEAHSQVDGSQLSGGDAYQRSTASWGEEGENVDSQFKDMFKQLKSAPPGSLTSRLATCMCIILHSYGTVRAVAHLWQEFVLEIRYRWEKGCTIPGLESGSPNMGCSLLHQKLQMLNCCIERKKARETLMNSGEPKPNDGSSTGPGQSSSDNEEEEDEFYECVDDSGDNRNGDSVPKAVDDQKSTNNSTGVDEGWTESTLDTSAVFSDSLTTLQADGRLRPFGSLKLLEMDDLLYVPVTQEPAPMTEDMLEEHAEVLAKLGTSAEGTHLRARMQSACLLSDMEAFKAANPGCVLGDFVRWYSPRDWIEQDVINEDGSTSHVGELSQRMQIPGNMWVEVWQSARPVPARRQRRLFDDTKEAEKVIHWLSSMTISDIAMRLMPMLVHSAISQLTSHGECHLPVLHKLVSHITNKAAQATRSTVDAKRFEDLIRSISQAEVVITRAQSLLTKFTRDTSSSEIAPTDLRDFVSNLLEQPEVNIIGAARAPVGLVVHRMFVNSQKSDVLMEGEEFDETTSSSWPPTKSSTSSTTGPGFEFPVPVGKEYILCTMINRPAPWSRPSPQRMYCVLTRGEFRLAGAFTTDTNFQ